MPEPKKVPIRSETKSTPSALTGPGFGSLDRLRREIDRMFESFHFGSLGPAFERSGPEIGWPRPSTWAVSPAVDMAESDTDYRLSAELPGLDEKDIEVRVANDTLTLKGEKKEEREEKDKDYYVSERCFGSFMRSFDIPEGVERDKITATFAKGVLTVTLPKSAKAQEEVRRVEVKAA